MLLGRVAIDEDVQPAYVVSTGSISYAGLVNGRSVKVVARAELVRIAETLAMDLSGDGNPTTGIQILESAATRVFWRRRMLNTVVLTLRLADLI